MNFPNNLMIIFNLFSRR